VLEFIPNISHHFQHRTFGVLPEVPGHKHLSDGRSKASGSRSDAGLPPRRRRDLPGRVPRVFFDDLASLLVHEADRGSGRPPHHVVGHVAFRLLGQEGRQVAQVAGSVQDNALVVIYLINGNSLMRVLIKFL
jgi:hypothetical protein